MLLPGAQYGIIGKMQNLIHPDDTRVAVPPLRQLDTSRCTLGFSATFKTLIRRDMPAPDKGSGELSC